jgi:hypothetical protein
MEHAVAESVICRLLPAPVRARSQVRSCGICGEQSGIVAFLPVSRPNSHSIKCCMFINRPVIASINNRQLTIAIHQISLSFRDFFGSPPTWFHKFALVLPALPYKKRSSE